MEDQLVDAAAGPVVTGDDIEARTVFSTLYNESPEFLERYISNFLEYTEAGVLYINLPESLYEQVHEGARLRSPRLKIGERVFLVRAHAPRTAFGAGLLLAHLHNFDLACAERAFDYFCTLASNSLFFRRFSAQAVASAWTEAPKKAEVPLREENPEGNWPKIRGAATFMKFFDDRAITHFCCNQIEGFFTSRDNWALIAAEREAITGIEQSFDSEKDRFPVEEVLPGTVIATMGDGRFIHLCWNLWERKVWGGKADVSDLVFEAERRYPANTFLLKWFDRSMDAPTTRLLFDDAALSRARQAHELLTRASTADLVLYRQIFDSAVHFASEELRGADLLRTVMGEHTSDTLWVDLRREARRQNIEVFQDRGLDSYVFYEELAPASYGFQLKLRPQPRVSACVSWLEENTQVITENKRDMVAYWYLKLDASQITPLTWLQLAVSDTTTGDPAVLARSFGCIVLRLNGRYINLFADYVFQSAPLLFDFHLSLREQGIESAVTDAYIGLPVINRQPASYQVSLLRAAKPPLGTS